MVGACHADQIREMEEKIMLNNKEDMSKLESFMKVLTGHFDNKEQYARMQKAGNYILMRNMSTQSAMTRSRISPQIFRENFL